MALRQARGLVLGDAKRRFLDAANADRSGGRHSTGVRWWVLFRVWGRGRSPIPDPRRLRSDWQYALELEDELEDFAIWLAVCRPSGRQVSHESIGKYISSVRAWYQRFYRARLGLGSEHSRIRDILKGYAREVPQPPPLEREGCTPADLRAGMDVVLADGSPRSVMWRALLQTALVGLMRGCEVALDDVRGERFEAEQHLVPADVTFLRSGDVESARLRMRKRKDMRMLRGKHDAVLIAGGGRHLDAVAALAAWVRERGRMGLAADGPLFCDERGAMVSVAQVRVMVRCCMQAAGRDPRLFGAHSLRIGGATAALAAGVPPERIRVMGRWSSDVYAIYCRMSVQAALQVSAAISSAVVAPTAPAFHEEHLELLPQEVEEYRREFVVEGDEVEMGREED